MQLAALYTFAPLARSLVPVDPGPWDHAKNGIMTEGREAS